MSAGAKIDRITPLPRRDTVYFCSGGQQWLNLQQAVQGTPVPYAGSGPYKDSRVLRCTPIEVSSNCLVIFNKDSQNRWRWRAMVMPTR